MQSHSTYSSSNRTRYRESNPPAELALPNVSDAVFKTGGNRLHDEDDQALELKWKRDDDAPENEGIKSTPV